MRYDDRLATVLRLPISGPAMARVQLTQLLDLLGTAPAQARGDLLDAGYLRVTALAREFPVNEVATMLAEPGLRLRSPRLAASLCHVAPSVARAALYAAQLDEASWLDLIPALPSACWSMLWQRRDLPEAPRAALARLGGGHLALPGGNFAADSSAPGDAAAHKSPAESGASTAASVGTEPPPNGRFHAAFTSTPTPANPAPEAPMAGDVTTATPDAPTPSAPIWQHQPDDGIGAIVRRIEAFRRARDAAQREAAVPSSQEAPRLPLGEEPAPASPEAFDVETDCEGCVIRADASVAPMVVGLELGDINAETGHLADLIRHQQPIRASAFNLAGAPAIAGAWQLDAIPQFDRLGGRFVGYLGRFRRLPEAQAIAQPAPPPGANPAASPADSHADRLRQSLHELRTPVNAIQGFAEIIQQQLFGPTPHEYRALAAVIAADAARMLAGFEELERLARIDTGAMEMASGTSDLAECVGATLARLEHHAKTHGITLALDGMARPLPLTLAEIETERLCWRLLATLVASATTGERLHLCLTDEDGAACLTLTLPAALAALTEEAAGDALFRAAVSPAPEGPSAGMFGTGFALRLARAEARAAGGSLTIDRQQGTACLRLRLPGLTTNSASHSVDLRGKIS